MGRDLIVPIALGKQAIEKYSLETGSTLWKLPGEAVIAGIIGTGEGFVAVTAEGTVRSYGMGGEELWAATPGGRVRSRPTYVDGIIIVADEAGCVSALAEADGSVMWQHCQGRPVYMALQLLGSAVVVPTTRGVVEFLDATTGDVVSAHVLPDQSVRFTSAGVGMGIGVLGTSDGRLMAFGTNGEKLLWEVIGLDPFVGASAVVDGYVFAASTGSILYAFDLGSGTEIWNQELRGRAKTGLTEAYGVLIVLTEPRHVQAFRTVNATVVE